MDYVCMCLLHCCSSIQTARFNTGNLPVFSGPPTRLPVCAYPVNLILHFNSAARRPFSAIPVIVLIYLLALLMVSKVKIYRRPHVFYKREYSNEP